MDSKLQNLSPSAKAAILMVVAVLFFSFMDAIVKGLSSRLHPMQVVWGRYSFQTLYTFILLAPSLSTLIKTKWLKFQLLRSLFLFCGTMCFFFSLSVMPLANATAIFEIAPLIITVMAFIFLKEHVGWRRLSAVCLGLFGAMVIIRPGTDSFTAFSILPAMAALFYASYTISTRALGREESPWTNLIYTSLIGTILASLIVPYYWSSPTFMDWLIMAAMGGFGMTGHILLIKALSIGEASFLAPFGYISLAYNALWGFVFYSEVPDIYVVLGAAIIVGAGLFIWRIESTKKEQAN